MLSPGLFIPSFCRFLQYLIIQQNGLSHRLHLMEAPGARGIVTAFARILVSEPCWPLDMIAIPALAADNPSPDFPAIHPVLTRRSRG